MGLEILFEDKDIIVCYKPAGVATQTKSVGQKDMVTMLCNHLSENGEKPEVHVIHRLDQPVEGVMIFAKNQEASAKLTKQVTDRVFKKKYYAIITRETFPDEGTLEDYMVKDMRANTSKVVSSDNPRAKKAVLKYKIVDEWDTRRMAEVDLLTGRHHQIRLQFASRTAPLLGDVKYGGESTGRNLALCSYYIKFTHPRTGEEQEFTITPKGEDFKDSSLFS